MYRNDSFPWLLYCQTNMGGYTHRQLYVVLLQCKFLCLDAMTLDTKVCPHYGVFIRRILYYYKNIIMMLILIILYVNLPRSLFHIITINSRPLWSLKCVRLERTFNFINLHLVIKKYNNKVYNMKSMVLKYNDVM
jgi:hypothetical protein